MISEATWRGFSCLQIWRFKYGQWIPLRQINQLAGSCKNCVRFKNHRWIADLLFCARCITAQKPHTRDYQKGFVTWTDQNDFFHNVARTGKSLAWHAVDHLDSWIFCTWSSADPLKPHATVHVKIILNNFTSDFRGDFALKILRPIFKKN